jgi:predicted ArsR family transcriptional regulator
MCFRIPRVVTPFEQRFEELAALAEPARRALYFYVAGRPGDVSREEAARAVGITRSLAGFHLDRLAKEGLLEASFRRLSGRSGPGAGRPAKLYRRSRRQIDVSLPRRNYELAAQVLAAAIDANEAPNSRAPLLESARSAGRRIGAEARARAGSRAGQKKLLQAMTGSLEGRGYEPRAESGEVVLRNCPFQAVAGDYTEVVCGMNLALMEGVVEGLGLDGMTPVLAPVPGACCVRLRTRAKKERPLTSSRK